MRLSVLDQSPVRAGASPADAVRETLELAALCDRLGYHRYWLAEHHSLPGLAGSCPEILIGQVAARTGRIRVGSGGVMLSHYAPLKIAEQFRMLEALYPGRIDLGIGRAPGSDALTARALSPDGRGMSVERFPQQISELRAFMADEIPAGHPHAAVRAVPEGPSSPPLWLLGSSDQSAVYAAHFGARFAFAHFINPHGGDQVMAAYREYFRPVPDCPAPEGALAVFVICAQDDEQAAWLRLSRDLWLVRLAQNRLGPFPTPEEAREHAYTAQERALLEANRARSLSGGPETVRQGLLELAGRYGVEELILVTICHDFQARMRSYELIAGAFGLDQDG